MANDNETVREVCAEIITKFFDRGYRSFLAMPIEYVREYHNRIESAYEREMAAKDAEIARLKAALQPVMDVNLDGMDSYIRVNCESILKSIIIEAQRIYKEGCAE